MMGLITPDFDPLATAIDWLDACRSRSLEAVLGFYDDGATIECALERTSLTGHAALKAYWHPKLATDLARAFDLIDLLPHADGVLLDYKSHEAQPVRAYFRFTEAGSILYASCGPVGNAPLDWPKDHTAAHSS